MIRFIMIGLAWGLCGSPIIDQPLTNNPHLGERKEAVIHIYELSLGGKRSG